MRTFITTLTLASALITLPVLATDGDLSSQAAELEQSVRVQTREVMDALNAQAASDVRASIAVAMEQWLAVTESAPTSVARR